MMRGCPRSHHGHGGASCSCCRRGSRSCLVKAENQMLSVLVLNVVCLKPEPRTQTMSVKQRRFDTQTTEEDGKEAPSPLPPQPSTSNRHSRFLLRRRFAPGRGQSVSVAKLPPRFWFLPEPFLGFFYCVAESHSSLSASSSSASPSAAGAPRAPSAARLSHMPLRNASASRR
jgi:hypothetical protein